MKACRKMRLLLEWLAAGELEEVRRHRVEAHVRVCPDCQRELFAWRSLLAAAAKRPAEVSAEIEAIDWGKVTDKIMAGVEAQPAPGRRPLPSFPFAFLAAAAVLIVMVGLGLFFWTRANRATISPDDYGPLSEDLQGPLSEDLQGPLNEGFQGRLSASAATHLQSGLAREELISYLQQSQLMFTDLLKDCAGEEVAPWEIRLYSRKAKELLLKKKYFQQNLPAVEWLKIRNVSEQIDWLNYEILQLEDRQLCSQIDRLQRIMENEKLLLKIRMLERDLSDQLYQEV